MRRLIALAVAAGLATPAWGQEAFVSARPDRVAVAVYRDEPVDTTDLLAADPTYWANQGLALIVETRTVDLPAGEGVIRFRGLATGVIPQTATLDGLPAHVVERNTDFDLLTPAALLNRSVGETVQVVRTNVSTGREEVLPAIVRSGAAGAVLEIEGRVEALDCQGLTQRIVFDRVPEGLSDQPVLSVRTRAETAGRYTVTLAYLATGLQWSADYVARLNPDGTLGLTGWITLANFGGTGFADAPVQVVAGELNRDYETSPVQAYIQPRRMDCWPQDTTTRGSLVLEGRSTVVDYLATIPAMSNSLADEEANEIDEVVVTASLIARQSELGDYKLYTLPEPTDVNARQTKQVRFLEQPNVRFSRVYRYEVGDDDTDPDEPLPRPQVLLKLRNMESDGLGLPLPGGGISLVESRDGQALFAGETRLFDSAVGRPVELELGEAAGVSVVTGVLKRETWWADDVSWAKLSMAVTVFNDQEEAVEVEVAPQQQRWTTGFSILRSSQRPVTLDTGARAWRVRVPPGESRELTYTIRFMD